jgi:hypothetical protein
MGACPLCTPKRPIAALPRNDAMGQNRTSDFAADAVGSRRQRGAREAAKGVKPSATAALAPAIAAWRANEKPLGNWLGVLQKRRPKDLKRKRPRG